MKKVVSLLGISVLLSNPAMADDKDIRAFFEAKFAQAVANQKKDEEPRFAAAHMVQDEQTEADLTSTADEVEHDVFNDMNSADEFVQFRSAGSEDDEYDDSDDEDYDDEDYDNDEE